MVAVSVVCTNDQELVFPTKFPAEIIGPPISNIASDWLMHMYFYQPITKYIRKFCKPRKV